MFAPGQKWVQNNTGSRGSGTQFEPMPFPRPYLYNPVLEMIVPYFRDVYFLGTGYVI
jgi:hypothetical protein